MASGIWTNPYKDVSKDSWYYDYISALGKKDVLEESEFFYPSEYAQRKDLVEWLYKLYKCSGGKFSSFKNLPFTDVNFQAVNKEAISWAYENGITEGVSESEFLPFGTVTREQFATFVIRYADKFKVNLKVLEEAIPFKDFGVVSKYARSYIVACQMADILNGYENNCMRPEKGITRAEAVTVICNMVKNSESKTEGEKLLTGNDDYKNVYSQFEMFFEPEVFAGDVVSLDYFDDCAIVGDSISVTLMQYCNKTKALGNTTFLCAGSLSQTNALWEVSGKSVHPEYKGRKTKIEDAVADSGAKKVYIMLGMNCMSGRVDAALNDLVELTNRILKKSPDVQFIMQSVTPMAETSRIKNDSLNNDVINEYNSKLISLCREKKWYYINVAQYFKGEDGNLIPDYCSDSSNMGIHLKESAGDIWVQCLKKHIPDDFRQ